MDAITLQRTGDRPLKFQGELLAETSSYQHNGPSNTRWHEFALYRTGAGTYVCAIGYRTRWQGEFPYDAAFTAETAEGVIDQLRMTRPDEHLLGYPPGGQYAERQERVRSSLELAYDTAISELLQEIEPEEID